MRFQRLQSQVHLVLVLQLLFFLGAELFTSNCYVTLIPVLNGELKLKDILPVWSMAFVGNCLGIGIICWLFIMGGYQGDLIRPYMENMMVSDLNFDVIQLLIKAILCNFIVCVAAYAGVKIKDETARLLILMLLIMTFVLSGFEHCITNVGMFTMSVTIMGSAMDWGMLVLHMLISIIGNMIGGCCLGVLLYYIICIGRMSMSDVEVLSQIGKSKIQMMKDDPLRFFTRAILAGLYLGIAAIISYTLGALFSDNTAVSKVAVAGSFGIGLVAIIFLGAELFTGNCYVTLMPVLKGDLKLRDIMPAWIACYIGNCVGIGLICFLFIMGGSQTSILKPYLQSLIDTKLDFNVAQLIIRGIL